MAEWMITFDAGCRNCRAASDQVRSASSRSILEVRDLTDSEVADLRRKALG